MRLTFVSLKATCEPHTVKVGARRVAGFLVRHTGSRRELGYVWRVGDFDWHWRTPNEQHFGERSNQRAAVEVLVDIAKLGEPATAHYTRPLPFEVEPPPVRRDPPKVKVIKPVYHGAGRGPATTPPPPPPAPAPPKAKPIQWSDAPDLTDAVARALRRQKGGS